MLWLSSKYGLYGLVGAFTIASIIDASLLFCILKWKVLTPIPREFYLAIGKILFSAIGAGAVGYAALYGVEPFLDTHTFFGILTQCVIAGTLSVACYLFLSSVFQIEEFNQFKRSFQRKILKTNIETTEIIPE
jgi:peptidoglycan biosynthesis protein MviN/MurJ (putative lipid II flippase)